MQTTNNHLKTMPYTEYLKTPEWQQKRQQALVAAQYRCQVCNSSRRLNVHHRTYERRGHELSGDLTVLCNDCHELFHEHRKLAIRCQPLTFWEIMGDTVRALWLLWFG